MLVDTLAAMVPDQGGNAEATRREIASLLYDALAPRDAVEAMLAARVVAAHHATMDNYTRAAQDGLSTEKVLRIYAKAIAAGRAFDTGLRMIEKRRKEQAITAVAETRKPVATKPQPPPPAKPRMANPIMPALPAKPLRRSDYSNSTGWSAYSDWRRRLPFPRSAAHPARKSFTSAQNRMGCCSNMKCVAPGISSARAPGMYAASALNTFGSVPLVSAPPTNSVGTRERLTLLVDLPQQRARIIAPGLPHRGRHKRPALADEIGEDCQPAVDVTGGNAFRRNVIAIAKRGRRHAVRMQRRIQIAARLGQHQPAQQLRSLLRHAECDMAAARMAHRSTRPMPSASMKSITSATCRDDVVGAVAVPVLREQVR